MKRTRLDKPSSAQCPSSACVLEKPRLDQSGSVQVPSSPSVLEQLDSVEMLDPFEDSQVLLSADSCVHDIYVGELDGLGEPEDVYNAGPSEPQYVYDSQVPDPGPSEPAQVDTQMPDNELAEVLASWVSWANEAA